MEQEQKTKLMKLSNKARIDRLERAIKELADVVVFKYKYDNYIN